MAKKKAKWLKARVPLHVFMLGFLVHYGGQFLDGGSGELQKLGEDHGEVPKGLYGYQTRGGYMLVRHTETEVISKRVPYNPKVVKMPRVYSKTLAGKLQMPKIQL